MIAVATMLKVILISLVFLDAVPAARILMTSPQMKSHTLEQLSIGQELAARGHDVYIAIGSPHPNPQSFERVGIRTLKYQIPEGELYMISTEAERKIIRDIVFNLNEFAAAFLELNKLSCHLIARDCALMVSDNEFIETVKRLKFDLVIVEPFIIAPCTLILPKYLDIPFVSFATFYLPWEIRVPALPSFSPLMETWVSHADVSFTSRLSNFYTYLMMENMYQFSKHESDAILRKFAPDVSTWNDILRRSELILTGFDHHLAGVVPSMPHFISVAGHTATKAEKLPDDLDEFFQRSTSGVVFLSFGSTADHFPVEVIGKFFDAFSKLKLISVVAKFTLPSGFEVPTNVKVLSWLPQNDILGHVKTKLFITHCGNNGQYEALYHGVPMIGFPLFAEQELNCRRTQKRGFSITMNIHNFTSKELLQNIEGVLDNPKYKTAIRKASEIFRDQPMHPRERAAFWIEHVIRHGGGHLRSLSMDMPLYQFLMLDVLGAGILVALCCAVVLRCVIKLSIRYFRRRSSSKLKSH